MARKRQQRKNLGLFDVPHRHEEGDEIAVLGGPSGNSGLFGDPGQSSGLFDAPDRVPGEMPGLFDRPAPRRNYRRASNTDAASGSSERSP